MVQIMSDIMNKPGIVSVANSGGTKLCTITLNGSTTGFEDAYLMGVRTMEAADVQYDKALDNSVLFTVFGDQMVVLSIRVLQPRIDACEGKVAPVSLETLYNQYKISSATRQVLKIAVDKTVYKGYMVNKECSPQQAGNGSVAGFVFDIKVVGVRA